METFVRIILLIIGGFFTYTGYNITSRFRKTEKLIGGMVLLIIGVMLILYSLGLIALPFIN